MGCVFRQKALILQNDFVKALIVHFKLLQWLGTVIDFRLNE